MVEKGQVSQLLTPSRPRPSGACGSRPTGPWHKCRGRPRPRPSWNMWVICQYYLLWMVFGVLKADTPKSTLCDNNATSRISCDSQLWGTNVPNNSACWLLLPPDAPERNSSGCDAVEFSRDISTAPDTFGKVSLKTYYFYEFQQLHTQTAFNVTFSNVAWTNLKMRFKQIGVNTSNFCRYFNISSGSPVPPASVLFDDCLWKLQEYESSQYIFEYSAHNERDGASAVGKYLFFVPNASEINPMERNLNKFKLFLYMDLSEFPFLQLRLQVPQNNFMDVNPDDILKYKVILHHKKTEKDTGSSLPLNPLSDIADELTFKYDTREEIGDYYFTAQIDHTSCSSYEEGCLISQTPVYSIPDDIHLRLLIGIVGCGGALLSIFTFVYFIWRWSVRNEKGDTPTVLIIYVPTTKAHIRCVVEFAKFLQNVCYVNALLDELEIPKTKTQDPFIWCNDAFLRSDFVMVVSSPYHQCNSYEGIYRNVDVLGLRNLKEKLGDRKSKQKFFSVTLSYCTEKDIPSEAKNLKRFVLLKDLDKMLSFLHSTAFRGKIDLEEDGWAFLEALRKAESELEAQKCICNGSECQKLTLDALQTIDLTPSKDSSEDMLLPQRDKTAVEALNMYPGPIDDLNLLGKEGFEVADSDSTSQQKPAKNAIIDINDLNLG